MVSETSHEPSDLHWSRRLRDTETLLPAGTLVADRFEVVEPLAHGGTATVYRAIDRECSVPVALKVVSASANRVETAARFENEARLGNSLAGHPMLVRPLQVGCLGGPAGFEGRSFLVTELVDGESLAAVMSRSHGGLPVHRALALGRDIASVLAALHERGIVHRDIKPGNIIVTGQGTEERLRLIDFGLAYATGDGWEAKSPDLTEAGHAPGTPFYMSPQQVAHGRPTPAMDMYSLGITLYEMLTGHPPFHGMAIGDLLGYKCDRKRQPYPVERLCKGLPDAAARLVDRCLRHDPAKRPSAAEVVAALDDLLVHGDEALTVAVERATPRVVVERAAPAELPSLPRPADVLGGRFEIIDEIGAGGMGHVYAARDRSREETVALKLIIPRYLEGRPERVKRFFLEFELASRIAGHPNVVQMHEAGYVEHGGVQWPFLSMELLEGEDLHGYLVFREPWLPEVLRKGRQVADTLRALHAASVVHRDVSSSNVWVCSDGRVKLIDFNLAGDLLAPRVAVGDPRRLTITNDMLGNLHYMAPEQARRDPPHPSADVYSFGLLLAELVTGRRPRQHVVDAVFVPELLLGQVPPVRLDDPGLPASVVELVSACTHVAPSDRPSMDEVVARLDEAIAEVSVEGWSPPPRRDSQDERVMIPIEEAREALVDAIARGTVAPDKLEEFDRRRAEAKGEIPMRVEPAMPAVVPQPVRVEPAWPVVTMEPPPTLEPGQPVAAGRPAQVELEAVTGRKRLWIAGAVAGGLAFVLIAWGLGSGQGRGDAEPAASVAGGSDRESEVEPRAEPDDSAQTPDAGSGDADSDADAAGSSDGAQQPEPVVEPPQPEPEPTSTAPAPKKVKPHSPRGDEDTERCAAEVQQAREAAAKERWADVIRLTKSAACFRPHAVGERLRLRVEALAETGRYAECVELGARSSDPVVARQVQVCTAHLPKQEQP